MGIVARSIRRRRQVAAKPGVQADDWLLERRPTSYWAATRRPFPSLLLVAPLVLAYECGVLWLGKSVPGSVRTGADTWMRNGLSSLGLSDHWLLPLLLFLILLTWQVLNFYDWRFSPGRPNFRVGGSFPRRLAAGTWYLTRQSAVACLYSPHIA